MSNTAKKLMVRVVKKRMEAGENFDEIIADYPKLTEDEIAELREIIES